MALAIFAREILFTPRRTRPPSPFPARTTLRAKTLPAKRDVRYFRKSTLRWLTPSEGPRGHASQNSLVHNGAGVGG